MTAMKDRDTLGVRSFVAATLLAAVAMALGCNNDPTVWKKDIPSPNGAWVATTRTRQWGGFGSAWVETTVSIRKLDGTVNKGKPFDVLSYPGGGPIPKTYVLSDANLDPDLQVSWLTPTHLQIAHRSAINPDLQVIRFSHVDISFAK
jgi:hypothetical protein